MLLLALILGLFLALPVASASATFQPHLWSLSASGGVPGNTITITGYGFGATQALTSGVGFGFQDAAITSWSDTQIVCTVPTQGVYGLVYVKVFDTTAGSFYSNELPFVAEDPALWAERLTPNHGVAGTVVTLTGHGFGSAQGSSFVDLLGMAYPPKVTPTSWSDTSITFTVPGGMAVGQHEVVVFVVDAGFNATNVMIFNVDPAIASLSPTKARPGATVTISGTGFGPTRGTSKVYFGKKIATSYVSWSDTKIKVRVPRIAAGSRPVKVWTRSGTSATKAFKVL
jgi:hypothetical protein